MKHNLRSNSQSQTTMSEINDLKIHIEELIKPLVKSSDLKIALQEIKEELMSRIKSLEEKFVEKDRQINEQSRKIEELESNLAISKNTIEKIHIKCDDNEQYSRRQCLRIYGLPLEKKEDMNDKIKGCYESMEIPFNPNDIDRAHRVGKIKEDKVTNKKVQAIIVKFKSWEARKVFYKARPKNHNVEKKPGSFSVGLDLTKRRLNLLMSAREKLEQIKCDRFAYVFADINCSLGIKYNDDKDSLKFFNTTKEFDELIS